MLLAVAAQGRAHAAASRDTRVCRATAATPGIATGESVAPLPRQRTGGRRTLHGSLREAACWAWRRGLSASRRWQVEALVADGNVRAAPVLASASGPTVGACDANRSIRSWSTLTASGDVSR